MAVTVCHTINHVWSLSPERDETVEREFFAESDCRHRTVSHNAGTASISSQIAGTGLHVRLQAQDFMSDCRYRTSCQTCRHRTLCQTCRHRTSCQTAGTGLHVRLQAQDFMSDMQAQDFMSDCRHRTSCKTAGTGLHVRLQAQNFKSDCKNTARSYWTAR